MDYPESGEDAQCEDEDDEGEEEGGESDNGLTPVALGAHLVVVAGRCNVTVS